MAAIKKRSDRVDGRDPSRDPLVSVVMSVFNGGAFLGESVSSILGQDFRDFEFIIIDDGSTDASPGILDSYQKRDSRIRLVHQGNQGLAAALNLGCSLARGRYIARMDADDVADDRRLGLQVDFMEAHPEIGVLGCAVNWIDGSGRGLRRCAMPVKDEEIRTALNRGDCPLWHPTVLIRRNAFCAVGAYRTSMVDAEDYDLWLRISDRFQLANLENVLVRYRVHPNQVSVRKWRQQAISNLAARVSASVRRRGEPDPFDSAAEITPALLGALGVSEAQQQTTIARRCVTCVSSLCAAGDYTAALQGIEEMQRMPRLDLVDSPEIADFRLVKAQLYWHRGQYFRSLGAALQAVAGRPVIAGRPLKPMLRRILTPESPDPMIVKI